MTGGILQLVAIGVDNIYLTGDPQITMFKIVYRRHSNFSLFQNIIPFKGISRFGNESSIDLKGVGDLLYKLVLMIEIPEITIKFEDPTALRISSLLGKYGIIWNYESDGFDAKTKVKLTDYNTFIKPVIYAKILDLVEKYNESVRVIFDIDIVYATTPDTTRDLIIQAFIKILQDFGGDELTNIRILMEGLYAFFNDILADTDNLNTSAYNASEIKNVIYNSYVNKIIKFITTIDGTTFDPTASVDDDTFININNSLILYHVLDFGSYTVLQDKIGIPTKQYFDEILSKGFTSTNDTFVNYDAYKIYLKYLDSLDTFYQLLDSTNNLVLVKNNLLDNIIWNVRRNLHQMKAVFDFLKNTIYDYVSDQHYRIGYYKKYNQVGNIISGTNTVFNSIFENTTAELADNFAGNLLLNALSGEPTGTVTQFFTNDVINNIRQLVLDIQDELGKTTYTDYFGSFSLFQRLLLNNESMRTRLRDPLLNTAGKNLTSFISVLSEKQKSRMSICNYIPYLTVRDIAHMVYDMLKTITFTFNANTTTNQEIRDYMMIKLDLRDYDHRIYTSEGFVVDEGDVVVDADDILAFKQGLYTDMATGCMFDSDLSRLIDETYLSFEYNTFATSDEYILSLLFRPEQVLTTSDGVYKDVLPIKYTVEEYRAKYLALIEEFRTEKGLTTSLVAPLKTAVNNMVNCFVRDSIPTFTRYAANGYTLFNVDNNIVAPPTTPKYCDAMASIWYRINKKMVRLYNTLFNTVVLSRTYYSTNLGQNMEANFTRFKNILVDEKDIQYFDGTNNETDDLNNIDPNVSQGTIYSASDYPVATEGFNFYLLRTFSDPNPYDTLLTYLTNLISYYETITTRYTTYKPILNIKNENINRRLFLFNTVASITHEYTQRILTKYVNILTDEDVISTLTLLIDDVETDINGTYLGIIDKLQQNDNIDFSSKSIKEVIGMSTSVTNDYTTTNLIEWKNTYTVDQLTNAYNSLVDTYIPSITPISFFTNPNAKKDYDSYKKMINILSYVMDFIIKSTKYKFLVNTIESTIALQNTTIINSAINDVNNFRNKLSQIVTIKSDLPIVSGYRYPFYEFDGTDTDTENNTMTYKDSTLDVSLVNQINQIKPKYGWVNELGHRAIDTLGIESDGQVIDEHNSDLIHILHKLHIDDNHERGYNIMIGNTKDMTDIKSEIRPKMQLYIPLRFWFCKDVGNALPLISILHSNLRIRLKTRPLEDLLFREEGSILAKTPKIKCQLLGTYMYLEEEERKQISRGKNEYLIERYQYNGSEILRKGDFVDNTLSAQLYFKDPTKYIIFTMSVNDSIVDVKDKLNWFNKGYRVRDNENQLSIIKRAVSDIKFRFNGRDREILKQESFYANVEPYIRYMGSLDNGEYIYSFSVYPLIHQPSGSANLTEIEDLDLVFYVFDQFKKEVEDNNLSITINAWACSYTVLRIMSGFVAPAFYS